MVRTIQGLPIAMKRQFAAGAMAKEESPGMGFASGRSLERDMRRTYAHSAPSGQSCFPIERHQGELPGKGSSMFRGMRGQPREAQLHALGSILVVDDDVEFCSILSEVLNGFGFYVQVATTVERALAYLAEKTPDLIMTDITMPEEDGLALIRNLRIRPAWCTIPTVIVSALPRGEVISLTERIGADAFLGKPFSIRKLRSTIAPLVSHPALGACLGFHPRTDDRWTLR
jgi:CheY-like chemotaxis protein